MERNILPLINNLLENREMDLDDGRFLMHSQRFDTLAVCSSHLPFERKIERVDSKFRVLGILRVRETSKGPIALDPPLRSRLQSRFIPPLSSESVLQLLQSVQQRELTSWPLEESSPLFLSLQSFIVQLLKLRESLARAESANYRDLVSRPPSFPDSSSVLLVRAVTRHPFFLEAEGKDVLFRLICRLYPYRLMPGSVPVDAIDSALKKFNFLPQFSNAKADDPLQLFSPSLSIKRLDLFARNSFTATILYQSQSLNREPLATRESSFIISNISQTTFSAVSSQKDSSKVFPLPHQKSPFISTSINQHILCEMLLDHSLGRDLCLVGSKGSGKSFLISRFSQLLGYRRIPYTVLLYSDLSSRDLMLRRVSLENQETHSTEQRGVKGVIGPADTAWEFSPLIRAALEGEIAVLDNIDRLSSSVLEALTSLIEDREITLFDGTRLVGQQEFDLLCKEHSLSPERLKEVHRILPVHPSFRIIATADVSSCGGSSSAKKLSHEIFRLFSFHVIDYLTSSSASPIDTNGSRIKQELVQLLVQKVDGVSPKLVKRLVDFASQLKNTQDSGSGAKIIFSLRHMIRILQKISYEMDSIRQSNSIIDTEQKTATLQPQKEKLLNATKRLAPLISNAIHNACMSYYAPSTLFQSIDRILSNVGLDERQWDPSWIVPESESPTPPDSSNQTKWKYAATAASDVERIRHLIPHVVFYENKWQQRIVDEMQHELELGHHLLLLGFQGTAKNKLCDYLLQRLSAPRQYIQLHRDVTVQSLTSQPVLMDGKLRFQDSPLIEAIQKGYVVLIDEADKAPREVVAVLKYIVQEQAAMQLPDGRMILSPSTISTDNHNDNHIEDNDETTILIHSDFRMIVLANPPKWPFHGNDFFAECGDLFSCHFISNPDIEAQQIILQSYGPTVDSDLVLSIAKAFERLRELSEKGILNYPYSTREAISVIKHLQNFPSDSIAEALLNVFSFDSFDEHVRPHVLEVFKSAGISLPSEFLQLVNRSVYDRYVTQLLHDQSRRSSSSHLWQQKLIAANQRPLNGPKHGKEDPQNDPHVGGNTWAGGTGGSDTAGLGGRGGPYRLDKGHPIFQVSDADKKAVSQEIQEAARFIAQRELEARLREIDMSTFEAAEYERVLKNVQNEIHQLRQILDELRRQRKERVWVRHRTEGDLDDQKLIDALTGSRTVYKQRMEIASTSSPLPTNPHRHSAADPCDPSDSSSQTFLHFVVDVSGSMYRFNGLDGRLDRMLEIVLMIMESFAPSSGTLDNDNDHSGLQYCISAHSGDSHYVPLVMWNRPPADRKERYKILRRMIAHSQFCVSGDNTFEATQHAIESLDQKVRHALALSSAHSKAFVFLFSDANFDRYGLSPRSFASIMECRKEVQTYAFFIASLWDQATSLQKAYVGLPFSFLFPSFLTME